MERSNAIRQEQKLPISKEHWPHWFQDDPRWAVAQRAAASAHFARSTLLSKFLLFVVAESIEGREREITEHQIGVHVFDRRSGYSTVEDNIVRNYARQLRRRLADYFAGGGASEPLLIDIPLGGYVPVFVRVSEAHPPTEVRRLPVPVSIHTQPGAKDCGALAVVSRGNWKRWLLRASLLVAYSGILISLTWLISLRVGVPRRTPQPADLLWDALFNGTANT